MPIKHVFFDLDHTLWDFEYNAERAYEVCLTNHDINIGVQKFMSVYRSINHAYWKKYRENKVTKEELQYGRLKEAFDAVEISVSDDKINRIAKEFLVELPKFNQLFDGSLEILDCLKEKYTLHIITNGFNEVQHPKLVNSGLFDYFEEIITAESVGVRKPDPKIFHYALSKANAKACESIMIGDSYEADIQGAMNVGMKTIFFTPSTKTVKINEINRLLGIKKYLCHSQ